MTRKGDPRTLDNAVRGFNTSLPGANTAGLRQRRQLAQSRRFVYDGSNAPTCITCAEPRENRRALKCNRCSA